MRVGDPFTDGTTLGPVVSRAQFDKVQRLIQAGIDEKARARHGWRGSPRGHEPRLLREADGFRPRCGTT